MAVPGTPAAPGTSLENMGDGWYLTVSARTPSGGPITQYGFQIATNSSFTSYVGTNQTSYVYGTDVMSNTTYWVRTSARNADGWGPWSSAVVVNVGPRPPEAPIINTVTRNSDTSITLNWTNYTSSTRPYTSLQVLRSEWGGSGSVTTVLTLGPTATTATDTSVSANNRYQYRIRAFNGTTSVDSFSREVSTTPGAPTNVRGSKTDTSITLQWDTGSKYPTRTEIWHNGSLLATVNEGVTTYLHSGVTNTVPHAYELRHKTTGNPILYSAYSATYTVQLEAPPNAPTVLGDAGPSDAAAGHTIRWQHNPVDTSTQTTAEIQWRPVGSGTWNTRTVNGAGSATSFTTPDIANGASYEFQVRTKGTHPDWSPWSATHTVPFSPAPSVNVTGPTGTIGTATFNVTWTYIDNGGSAQSGAQVAVFNSAGEQVGSTISVNGSGTSEPFTTPLPNNFSGYTRVRARNAQGIWSTWDQEPFTTSFPSPMEPDVDVEWDDENGYVVVDIENPVPPGGTPPAGRVNLSPQPQPQINNQPGSVHYESAPQEVGISAYVVGANDGPVVGETGQQLTDYLRRTTIQPKTEGTTGFGVMGTSGNPVTGAAGDTIQVSFYVRYRGGTEQLPILRVYTSDTPTGASHGDNDTAPGDIVIPRDGQWVRVTSAPFTTTQTYNYIHWWLYQVGTGAGQVPEADSTFDITGILIERNAGGVLDYFDGSTPTYQNAGGWNADSAWTGAEWLSTSTQTFTTPSGAVSNTVWRSVEGPDGPWEKVAEGVPLNSQYLDTTAPAGGDNVYYRVEGVSAIGATGNGQPSGVWYGDRCAHKIYLSGPAPMFNHICKGSYGVIDDQRFGLHERVLNRFAGRRFPVEFSSIQREHIIDLSCTVFPDVVQLPDTSTYAEWRHLSTLPGPLLYRDTSGNYMYVSPDLIDLAQGDANTWTMSTTLTGVEYDKPTS